jgi:hypothetical protein
MNDKEKQLWKSIIHKCSSKEKYFLYGVMDYIQKKSMHGNMYYLYIFANDVKTIIENESIDSIEKEMEYTDYTDINPEKYFD